MTAEMVPCARADKRTDHFDRPAAQQKGEGGAGESGSQAKFEGGIQPTDLLDLIQLRVELLSGFVNPFGREILDETFQTVQLGGIYPGVVQSEGIGKRFVPVKTGVNDRHEPDAGSTGNAQLL